MKSSQQIPVTIITGFLGSGKTTLLNRILTEQNGDRIAIIQNEFGDIGIDNDLVIKKDDGLFEMQNGCICCTVINDLVDTLEKLKNRKNDFDRLLIETTGLADPIPIAQTLLGSVLIQKDFVLDGIVTIVDSFYIEDQLHSTPEAKKQILAADLLVLNKAELCDTEELDRVKMRLTGINDDAKVVVTNYSTIETDLLFGISLFNADRFWEIEKQVEKHEHHHHDDEVTSLSIEIPGYIDLERLDAWLSMIGILGGNSIYRMKGILSLKDDDRRFVFQSVFSILKGQFGNEWQDGEERMNKFVFIGKKLNHDLLNDGFRACLVQ